MLRKLAVWIGVLFAVVIVALLAVSLALPERTRVEESVVINAPQSEVFATLNNLREFNSWSPYVRLDPAADYTYSGPDSGVGAAMRWSGALVGEGGQAIVAVDPETRIELALEFAGQPEQRTWYELAPEGEATRVAWIYEGSDHGYNPIARWVGALIVEPRLGAEYANGLANLKVLIEGGPRAAIAGETRSTPKGDLLQAMPSVEGTSVALTQEPMPPGIDGELVMLEAAPVLLVDTEGTVGDGKANAALEAAFAKVIAYAEAHGLMLVGPPLAINKSFDEATTNWVFRAGMRIASAPETPPTAEDGLVLDETYAGRAAKFIHYGDPNAAGGTYAAIDAWLALNKLEVNGDSWEEYPFDPAQPTPEWRTHIYFPVK